MKKGNAGKMLTIILLICAGIIGVVTASIIRIRKNNASFSFGIEQESIKLMPQDSVTLTIIADKPSTYTWSSSDELVVTVNEDGTVTALKYGNATITASEPHGNSASMEVNVDAYDWELAQHTDDTGNQSMFYTLKNKDTGTLIVIDGGWAENAENVRRTIMDLGGHVDCWILTHSIMIM